MNRGDGFRRLEVVDGISDLLCALWGFQHMYVPPVEVLDDSDGELACFVDEQVNIKALLHPFKVVERHTLQSIETRTDKKYWRLSPLLRSSISSASSPVRMNSVQ